MPELNPPPRVARAGIAVHAALARAAFAILPSEVAVWRLSSSFITTRVLGTLVEHGVFDALAGGPATPAELARQLRLHAGPLGRLLRVAALEGLVRVDRRGRYRLTRTGRRLRTDDERSMGPWTLYLNRPATQDAWAAVGSALRDGAEPFSVANGQGVWAHFAAHPDEEREFAAAMRTLTEMIVPFVAGRYPWPQGATVCDVAGGVGTLLAGILRRRPDLRGVLVDAPGVIAQAPAVLQGAGVADRVELSAGDIFERIDASADLYLLKDVLHDWDDDRSLKILQTVRAAMPSGARVVLVETLQHPRRPDRIASLVDVHMLAQCDGGRQRSVPELQALLERAGLRRGRVIKTAGPALVEGVAA